MHAERFIADQQENEDPITRENVIEVLRVYAIENPNNESDDIYSNKKLGS